MKTIGYIFVIALALAAGFYLGRRSVNVDEATTVEYIEMPPAHVSIEAPSALRFTVPALPQWIFFTDTTTRQQRIDTAAILTDWIQRREYGGQLVADSTGTIDYSIILQYNRLQNITIDYFPLQKTVVTTKSITERWAPFLFVGGNTAGYVQVEGGVLFKRFALSAEFGAGAPGKYVGAKVGMRF
jgi:hypothetical protein